MGPLVSVAVAAVDRQVEWRPVRRWERTSAAKADARMLQLLSPVTIDDRGRFHKVARCPKGHHVDANVAPVVWLAGLSAGTLSFYCIECDVSAPPSAADRDAVLKALRHCGF